MSRQVSRAPRSTVLRGACAHLVWALAVLAALVLAAQALVVGWGADPTVSGLGTLERVADVFAWGLDAERVGDWTGWRSVASRVAAYSAAALTWLLAGLAASRLLRP